MGMLGFHGMGAPRRRFLASGATLAIAALLMRTVSVSFNAYTATEVGAEGIGLFTLTMSLYGFFLTLATSGVSLSVTCLVADAIGRRDGAYARGMLHRALGYAAVCGAAASAALFFGAPMLSRVLLRDHRTLISLRVLALGLLPMSFSSVFSGYFIAVRRASHNAAVQVSEQWIKIALTVLLLTQMLPMGVEYACLALVLGGVLGEMLSCLILFTVYVIDRVRHPFGGDALVEKRKAGMKPLFAIALPVAFGAYARSALLSLEHILIPMALASAVGGREGALASYGVLHSMAIPIVLYPMAVLSSFAGILVPEYTESLARRDERRLHRMTNESLSLSLLFAYAVCAALFLFGRELGVCLYHNADAGRYIYCLAPLVPLMYVDHVTDAMLKGIGMQVYSMVVNILDSVLSILLILLLLPRFGAMGYVFVIFIAEAFNLTCSYVCMYRKIGTGLPVRALFRPLPPLLLSCISMHLLTFGTADKAPGLVLKMLLFCALNLFFFTLLDGGGEKRDRGASQKKERTARAKERKCCGFSVQGVLPTAKK